MIVFIIDGYGIMSGEIEGIIESGVACADNADMFTGYTSQVFHFIKDSFSNQISNPRQVALYRHCSGSDDYSGITLFTDVCSDQELTLQVIEKRDLFKSNLYTARLNVTLKQGDHPLAGESIWKAGVVLDEIGIMNQPANITCLEQDRFDTIALQLYCRRDSGRASADDGDLEVIQIKNPPSTLFPTKYPNFNILYSAFPSVLLLKPS